MQKRSIAMLTAVIAAASLTVAALAATPLQDPGRAPGEAQKKAGPAMPDGPGFGPGMFLAPLVFEIADANKDGRLSAEEAAKAADLFVRDADPDKKGSIDAGALGLAINRKIGPPPGDGPGPGGPPGGFGPGTFLAPQVVEAADANKDGRLSPEEAFKAAEKFVRESDAKKVGSIDTDVLAAAMNRQMGPPPGFGGPGGPMGAERKIIKDYDKDSDGRLNMAERKVARDAMKVEREKNPRAGGRGMFGGPPGGGGPDGGGGPGGGGPGGGGRPGGGPPGFGGAEEPVKPGPHVEVADAKAFPGKKLYDPTVMRTFFLECEDQDWESAMTDFHGTDVEVPATLIVDGKKYPGVGLHFRGLSSYMGVREGHKRSFNVALDFVNPDQRLEGYKTLNLLNSHEDSTFLHSVLYFHIARNYIAAPKANFVRLVVNGESWGVYVNAQQFDKVLVSENYAGTMGKGARWKVRGNPGADGGLRYLGDDVAEYKKRYEIKTGDDDKDWKALATLCKILDQTPPDKLEAALKSILDVEGVLWFLALDNALINGDGYWTRASDYSIYRDPAGKFHVLPHDANETFGPPMMFGPPMGFGGGPRAGGPGGPGGGAGGRPGGGPGGPGGGGPGGPGGGGPGGGPGGGGGRPPKVDLDPLVGMEEARKPLRSKLLAVPALRSRYLEHVRTIAAEWLDWAKLGPIVAGYRGLIEKDIEGDTRKLSSFAAFQKSTADAAVEPDAPRGRETMGLRDFADQRRKYLLGYTEGKKATP